MASSEITDSRPWTRMVPSHDNHGPYIVVISYVLMSIMVLSTIARLRPGRHTFTVIPRLDESLLLLATVSHFLSSTEMCSEGSPGA